MYLGKHIFSRIPSFNNIRHKQRIDTHPRMHATSLSEWTHTSSYIYNFIYDTSYYTILKRFNSKLFCCVTLSYTLLIEERDLLVYYSKEGTNFIFLNFTWYKIFLFYYTHIFNRRESHFFFNVFNFSQEPFNSTKRKTDRSETLKLSWVNELCLAIYW